jgi:2-C-methyl-D-erythritol 4-phosphate cytidylyltransferase
MKKIAVIVAGGSGTRMGMEVPKQFLLLKEKPLLYFSIKAFLDAYEDMQVILVMHPGYLDRGQEIVDAYFDKERIRITAGGETRFHSVQKGLTLIEEESIIFVHDAVRCLLSVDLVRRCYEKAVTEGTAIPAIPSKDSIRLVTDNGPEVYDRNKVMLIQTPQTFHSKIIIPAYQIEYKEKFTDEATVAEAYGMNVSLVEGEDTNIKITRPLDLIIAEKVLQNFAT